MHVDLNTWRTIIIATSAVGQTLFVLLYITFPWWKTFLGRALFYKGLTMAVLLDALSLARIFGWAHDDQIFVILYSFVTIGIWWQLSAFARTKIQNRGDRT